MKCILVVALLGLLMQVGTAQEEREDIAEAAGGSAPSGGETTESVSVDDGNIKSDDGADAGPAAANRGFPFGSPRRRRKPSRPQCRKYSGYGSFRNGFCWGRYCDITIRWGLLECHHVRVSFLPGIKIKGVHCWNEYQNCGSGGKCRTLWRWRKITRWVRFNTLANQQWYFVRVWVRYPYACKCRTY